MRRRARTAVISARMPGSAVLRRAQADFRDAGAQRDVDQTHFTLRASHQAVQQAIGRFAIALSARYRQTKVSLVVLAVIAMPPGLQLRRQLAEHAGATGRSLPTKVSIDCGSERALRLGSLTPSTEVPLWASASCRRKSTTRTRQLSGL